MLSPGVPAQHWGSAMLSSPLFRFPSDLLLTSSSGELWRMVRIGGQPLGFGECHCGSALGYRDLGTPPLPPLCVTVLVTPRCRRLPR